MGLSVPVAEMGVVIGGFRQICLEMTSQERKIQMWLTGV